MLTMPTGRDEVSIAMPDFRPSSHTPQLDHAAHCNGIRDRILVGLVLYTLVRSSEALAGEQAAITGAALNPDLGSFRQSSSSTTALITAPTVFSAPADAGNPVFSSTEFRPRKRTIFDSEPNATALDDAPMLRGTTVWQRMSDYKSHDRVRLLTLWETRGSTVSLQAGKRGDPSLQWTSRLMNRGGSTRGLLDRWFSTSLADAGNRLRGASRSTSGAATAKPAGVAESAGLK
jgi:hypothetical protein